MGLHNFQISEPRGTVGMNRHEVEIQFRQAPEEAAPEGDSPNPAKHQEAKERQANDPIPQTG
jgi:hypothetical protein